MPVQYSVRITRKAHDDLTNICAYIEEKSPQNAAIVAQSMLDAIDSLAWFPQRFEVHEHRNDRSKTVRSMPVPPFIIYYRVTDAAGTVDVITIRHGHQRQPRRFS